MDVRQLILSVHVFHVSTKKIESWRRVLQSKKKEEHVRGNMGKTEISSNNEVADGEYSISSIDSKREVLDAARAKELLAPLIQSAEDGVMVHKVSLSGKSFSPDAARVAREVLKDVSKALRNLDMADVIAGQPEAPAKEALGEMCTAFAESKALEWLDVSDNAFGRKGIVCLEPLLLGQKDLKHVYFCNNGLAADAATLLVDFLKDSTQLETLHFHNNLLESAGAEILAKLIKDLANLKSFRFSTTRGTAPGIEALSKALKASSENLYHIEFTDNNVTPEGAHAVASLVKSASSLRSLRLRDCSLDDEGAKLILDAFLDCEEPLLKDLDLSGNDLTEDIASDIETSLSRLKRLEQLWLEDNELGPGAPQVMKALTSTSLKLVDLSCCEINSATAWQVAKILKSKKVEKVGLNGNEIGETTIEKIREHFGDKLGAMSDNESDGESPSLSDYEEEKDVEEVAGKENSDAVVDDLAGKLKEKLTL
eukprot:Plantae.Rhodophyta-Hildenbrandia_rubra.ctg1811.p2 GENE.Plantae.Rhodophyta-Hildenbrandia_rubra.ctg1811~~Plantae.Rhodophyta-Hildenbrandia_rubra.ctg1811.p2  ORF type:complete len:482 (+),score=103.99 Plantae.Rhodophyta-Hildenbrandia_rubra.ctg1811:690-2135(+)